MVKYKLTQGGRQVGTCTIIEGDYINLDELRVEPFSLRDVFVNYVHEIIHDCDRNEHELRHAFDLLQMLHANNCHYVFVVKTMRLVLNLGLNHAKIAVDSVWKQL